MMFEGKHIHYSPVDNKPLCSYSVKLCKQRRLKDYAFCIRHILEDKSAPFKQCAHVARYNNQKCTNPIPSIENREFCNSHMQVAGMLPKVQKRERKFKEKKERETSLPGDGRVKFADRLRALLRKESCGLALEDPASSDDPYAFPDPGSEPSESPPSQCFQQTRILWNSCSQQQPPPKQPPVDNHRDGSGSLSTKVDQIHLKNVSSSSSQQQSSQQQPTVASVTIKQSHNMATLQLQNNQTPTLVNNFVNCSSKNASITEGAKSKQHSLQQQTKQHSAQQQQTKLHPQQTNTTINTITTSTPTQHVPKFTKTMNRLQAKIAQNKLLDKLKKSQQESSQNGPVLTTGSVSPQPLPLEFNASNIKKEPGLMKGLPPSVNGNHKPMVGHHPSTPITPLSSPLSHHKTFSHALPTTSSGSQHGTKFIKKEPVDNSYSFCLEPTLGSRDQIKIHPASKNLAKLPSLTPPAPAPPVLQNATLQHKAFTKLNALPLPSNPNPTTSNPLPVTTTQKEIAASAAVPPLQTQSPLLVPVTSIKKEVVDLKIVKQEKLSPEPVKKNAKTMLGATTAAHRAGKCAANASAATTSAGKLPRRRKDDLFHYGVISSDSDDSDDFAMVQKFNWCSSLETNAATWCSTKATTRQGKQAALKSDLRRYGHLAKKVISIEECVLEHQLKMARNVVQAAQLYPKYTAQLLLRKTPSKTKKKLANIGLEKSQCCFQSEGSSCSSYALPYTRHCSKHIMYNVDQLLFEHCTAKFADNTQCCVPVFDICHELPLCHEHAKKRDNYNKMALEPKPKKVRKKTKPSALTRPPKRGKKKKRQNVLRPNSLPPSPVEDSSKFNSNTGATDNSDSITFSTTPGEGEIVSEGIPKPVDEPMEAELSTELEANFSPGTIEKSLELPLDTAELARQATKLLEEHDFTEVLNKIPDDAFSDLFTAFQLNRPAYENRKANVNLNSLDSVLNGVLFPSDGRNGEYIPTKEETEELERALAAVSKDVHLAKESLAKLTVTRQDIEELSSNIALPSALISAENLTSTLDANALHDMESLNVMTGLSSNELSSLSQAFHHEGLPHDNTGATAGSSSSSSGSSVQQQQHLAPPTHHPSIDANHHHHHHHLHHLPNLLAPNLTNGETVVGGTSPECLLNGPSEFGLGSQFLESAMTGYAAGTNHGILGLNAAAGVDGVDVNTAGGLIGTVGSLNIGTTLSSIQFNSSDGGIMSVSGILSNGRSGSSDDMLSSLPSLAGCGPHWLLNPSLALSQNVGCYQNGFLTSQGGPLLSQQLLSKFPLQGLSGGEVALLSNHHSPLGTTGMTDSNSYEDSLLCSALKDSVQGYNRAGSSNSETKPTILAQEGAS